MLKDELTIPRLGKLIVVTPRNEINIEDFPVQNPKEGEILIKTVCTLISAGTELGNMRLKRSNDYFPGYSNSGKVVKVGKGASRYKIGDPVLSLGNHASYVTVLAAPHSVVKIPKSVSFEEATFGVLGSVAMHGLRKARIELGEFVAIVGVGVVGQLTLQLAAQTGCEVLIAVDICNNRLQIAARNGATHILNPNFCNLKDEITAITRGRGLDVIIETSGYSDVIPQLFELSRIGGRIILIGSPWHMMAKVDFVPFLEKELNLIGCHQPKCPTCETPYFPWTQQYNRREILKMIGDGRINVKSLISHRLPYREASEGYRLLKEKKNESLGIILNW